MKAIARDEVLGLADYEAIREHFRARVIESKKLRRLQLGPRTSAVFENRDTVLLQIQEMLRTERITRESAIAHEIETYNENLPGEDELSCTLMIEIADAAERDEFLRAAVGFEKHLWLVGRERVPARSKERGDRSDRTTAVHYVKFKLPQPLADAMRRIAPRSELPPSLQLELLVDHPAYQARASLPIATLLELAEDLRA
jgi:hypothetical protein